MLLGEFDQDELEIVRKFIISPFLLFVYYRLSLHYVLNKQSSEPTEEVTGFFEVEINGKSVHSKKNGEGFVDSELKFQKILKEINNALKN